MSAYTRKQILERSQGATILYTNGATTRSNSSSPPPAAHYEISDVDVSLVRRGRVSAVANEGALSRFRRR